MANPLYGQNKHDSDASVFGVGKTNVITSAAGTLDLQADDSGAIVFLNDADGVVQLPAAAAGLQFKVVFGIDTTAGAKILAQSGDCFFGTLNVNSTTKAKCSAQSIDHATAIATVADYDTLDFTHDSQTLAGKAGDSVELICIDSTAWMVTGALVTDGNDPDAIAIINAS